MKKALLVGINNYPGKSKLNFCNNDATEISELLEKNEDGSPNFGTKLYLDVKTKGELKGHIRDLFSGGCETELFYFSGHGYLNELGGYIVTPDYSENDEGVSMNDILQYAHASKSSNRIIILDCCHSGQFGDSNLIGNQSAIINDGLTILTASKKSELSVEINGHGIFTNLLLSALNGGAADIIGNITPGSVYAYIDKALGPWEQRPVFKTNVTRFTSLRNVKPQISIEILRRIIEYFPDNVDVHKLDPSYEFTNSKEIEHNIIEPFAKTENVKKLKDLQKMESVGLVVPVGEEHMYFATMNFKACKLTSLGHHYWRLIKENRI